MSRRASLRVRPVEQNRPDVVAAFLEIATISNAPNHAVRALLKTGVLIASGAEWHRHAVNDRTPHHAVSHKVFHYA